MSKRTVHECDLTKIPFDPEDEEYFVLTIKKKGKKTGMIYDLTPEAAEKLLAQLNGGQDKILNPGWEFTNHITRAVSRHEDFNPVDEPGQREPVTDPENADAFVRDRKKEREELGIDDDDRPETTPAPQQAVTGRPKLTANQRACPHMNKGRAKWTMIPGRGPDGLVQYAYHICRDCSAELPIAPRDAQQTYMAAKASDGSRAGLHS